MTCARFEKDLALYVERDLPDAQVPAVEAHLGECADCRLLLDELRGSQALVKGLAAEDVDPATLATVRVRAIVAAARDQRSRREVIVPPAWAAAAAAVVVAAAVALAFLAGRHTDDHPNVAGVSRIPHVAPTTEPPPRVTEAPPPRSTPRAARRVSPHMEQAAARRAPAADRTEAAVPKLSREDADQLARAVVAVSRIRRVEDLRPDTEPSPEPTTLIRIASTDPNVVIYWRLEPNGED